MEGNKLDKQLLTSTGNNELSVRGCCRTCSRLFPSSTSPCWLGSGSARCKVPSRPVISPKGPSCRFDLIVGLRSSMKGEERKKNRDCTERWNNTFFFWKIRTTYAKKKNKKKMRTHLIVNTYNTHNRIHLSNIIKRTNRRKAIDERRRNI